MTWGRGVLCDVVHGNKRQMFASGALNMDTRDTTTRGCTFNNKYYMKTQQNTISYRCKMSMMNGKFGLHDLNNWRVCLYRAGGGYSLPYRYWHW